MSGSDWTETMLTQLTARWNAGETSAVIAAALGVSKNAVVGKARRLNLARRPSPIRVGDAAKTAAAPAKASPKSAMPTQVKKKLQPAAPAMEQPLPPAEPRLPPEGCRWPMWRHHELPTHRYCGEARQSPTQAYCPHHMAMAFGAPSRREAA